MSGIGRSIVIGFLGAVAFTFGACFPLHVILPPVLIVSGFVVVVAIVRDWIDARRARVRIPE